MNIDVAFGNKSMNFVLDTGANFSGIKRSLIGELGLKPLGAKFYITSATGKKVQSDLAIAEQLVIGKVILKNVVFLVLNDEDFTFPEYNYFPNGAIGFPVINAMGEIQINENKLLVVPKQSNKYNLNNLALDDLTPVIACLHQSDTLNFYLDTGARKTSLFKPFYTIYKEQMDEELEKEKFQFSSAGGSKEFDGYIINSISFTIGNSSASIEDIRLHVNDTDESEITKVHGNLGQDYIKQFKQMIISFDYATVLFNEKGNQ